MAAETLQPQQIVQGGRGIFPAWDLSAASRAQETLLHRVQEGLAFPVAFAATTWVLLEQYPGPEAGFP